MITIAYWSQTGNTQAMAEAVLEGVKSAGKDAKLVEIGEVSAAELKEEAVFALGCPAMGAEELEDSEVEPLVQEVEKFAAGKKIALFGSYDWGDGQWMRDWTERMAKAGATIVGGEGLTANNTPDDDALEACKNLGKQLAEA